MRFHPILNTRVIVLKTVLILFSSAFWSTAAAQVQVSDSTTYTVEYSGIEMYEALQDIAEKASIDIVVDPDIIENLYVYKRIIDQPFYQLLSEILEGSGLDFVVLSSGTVVVIRSTRLSPEYGTLGGQIVDAATGESLPGATVMLANASGGTSSNQNGYYSLGRLKSGSYDLLFSYVGYKPLRKTVNVKPNRQHRTEVALEPQNVNVRPIVVSAHQPMMPVESGDEISNRDRTIWGTDPVSAGGMRILNIFSGVQYGLPFNDLHIQGGQSGDHRMFLDGVPVYNPYSFGQLYSAFSPYALGRIQIEKAGFNVSSGSYISGKVNLYHELNSESGERGILQADPLHTNASFTIGKPGSTVRILGAFRSSLWNWYEAPSLSNTIQSWNDVDPLTYNILVNPEGDVPFFESTASQTDVNYHDAHLAGVIDLDDYRQLSFSLYQGRNFIETDLLTAGVKQPSENRMFGRDSYNWKNLISQIEYNWLVSPRFDLQLKTSYSSNLLDHQYAMFNSELITDITGNNAAPREEDLPVLSSSVDEALTQTDNNNIRHLSLKSEMGYAFSPNFTILAGLNYDYLFSSFNLNGLFYLPSLNKQKTSIYSSFLQTRWNLNSNMRLTAGSRFTLFGTDGAFYSEPRLSIQYDEAETSIGYWSIKLSGGIYRQFINKFDITNVGPSSLVPNFSVWSHDNSFKQPISYNSGIQIRWQPDESTTITADGYNRIQPRAYITSYQKLLTGEDQDQTGMASFAEITEMTAHGVGLRVHKSISDSKFEILLGYDYSDVQIEYNTQFGRTTEAPWNEPHRLQARLLSKITPQLTLVTNWQRVVGRAWGFRRSYYDFLTFHNFEKAGSFSFQSPENDRLDPFNQVDLKLVYTSEIVGTKTEFRLNLVNVLNQRNTIDWTLVPDENSESMSNPTGENQEFKIRKRKMNGFTPSVSIQIAF
ncbi:MAG: hypothetical protein GVY07_08240 [Bacteroidetes bacterium]|jgi:hypothetical protein|nr:hypothetical protein [Bacteroidota bacterium]